MEQKKAYRTFQFENVVAWKSEFRGTLSASGHPNVEVGNPPVFKGTPGRVVPRRFVDWSVECCLMLTFLYQTQRRHLEVVAYESGGQGTLEHSDGKYQRHLLLKFHRHTILHPTSLHLKESHRVQTVPELSQPVSLKRARPRSLNCVLTRFRTDAVPLRLGMAIRPREASF